VGCGFETDWAKRAEPRTMLPVSDLAIVLTTSSQEQAGFLLQNSQFKICLLTYPTRKKPLGLPMAQCLAVLRHFQEALGSNLSWETGYYV
jgi:hypothetical protein